MISASRVSCDYALGFFFFSFFMAGSYLVANAEKGGLPNKVTIVRCMWIY